MSSGLDKAIKDFVQVIQEAGNKGTSPLDTQAEVRRVEGDIAWVHIPGGVDETPVKLTIAAKAGDVVQVRAVGGRAWITGNASAPPTDDKTAIAAKSLADIAGNRANTAQKTADQAQIVANSALKGTKENAAQMAQMVINFNGDIENLQDQIDGNITTWFYDVDPAMGLPPVTDWDTDEKKNAHLGDIYYNTVKGYAWRFMKSGITYSWERITDMDVTKALADAAKAQDTADSKRRVFYNTPTVPYDVGDLWVQGSGGDILRCAQAKTSTGSYDRSDWVLASKYTDNSALNTWIEGDFATTIQELEEGLVDAKVETYYQTTDPSTGWSDTQKSEHKGDLWYNSTASVQRYYRWSGTAWQELTATPPQAVFDNIDRKATIYIGTTTPTNPDSGDLWFKGANEPILTYVNNSWVEYNKYTDDTAANTAKATADTAQSTAIAAKNAADSAARASSTAQSKADEATRAASDAQSSAATAAQAAATAQSTADAAKASASSASSAAATAQSKADSAGTAAINATKAANSAGEAASVAQAAAEAAKDTAASSKITADSAATAAGTAQTAADAAQSIADSAGKAARDAQTKAEAADAKADKAAKTATDYLYSNEGDLVIAEKDPAEPVKGNLKIMGDGIAIRNGDKTLADYSGSSAKFYGVATEVEKLTTQPSDWGASSGNTYLWKYARVPSRPTFNGGLLTEAPISADWSKLTWNYIKANKPVSWGSLGVILLNFDKDTVWPKGHGLTVTFETPTQDGTLYFDSTKDESMMVQFRPTGGALTNITKDVQWKYTGKISQADALSVTQADYIYSYNNTQKGEISHTGEFYRFTGSAMIRVSFTSDPSFVDGEVYRRSDYQSEVPVSAIQSAGITLSYGSNLYYRQSVQYGQANSTPKDYAGYYKFVDGQGMQTVSTGTLPEWVDNYIYTASPTEFRKVPEALGSLIFIPNLFYRETTVYTQTAEFGSTGATVGPKQGGHATFTADGMTVYIGDEAEASNKVAFFGKNSILNLIYPVGSIYMSTNATSPATLFGGTWERIQDRFLLAAGTEFPAGKRDGEATHTLTADELPDHRHTFTTDSAGDHTHSLNRVLGNSGGNWTGDTAGNLSGSGRKFGYIDSNYTVKTVTNTGSGGQHTHTGTTDGAGGTQSHNNMPPYLAVYMWKRTA